MASEESYTIRVVEGDPLAHLDESPLARHTEAGGCFSLIGPIGICWELQGLKIKVCLKIGPVKFPCAVIDAPGGCVTLEANAVCAKASIQVCLDGKCLVYNGKACYRDLPCMGAWNCVEVKGTIVCFP